MDTLTVGELARFAGITVRTLHHYDEIGLLPATMRTESGYRRYAPSDVDRLRAILTYRELGLGLDEIALVIESPESSVETLRSARDRVGRRIARLESIAGDLDAAIDAETKGVDMTPEEKLAIFGDFDPADYEQEAEERWGDTDAFRESARRTASYTTEDWQRLQLEASAIYGRFLEQMEANADPGSPAVRDIVEAHRRHIGDWFYECSPEMHHGLGVMYVADERFTENIDKAGEGLAAYMSVAIAAAYA